MTCPTFVKKKKILHLLGKKKEKNAPRKYFCQNVIQQKQKSNYNWWIIMTQSNCVGGLSYTMRFTNRQQEHKKEWKIGVKETLQWKKSIENDVRTLHLHWKSKDFRICTCELNIIIIIKSSCNSIHLPFFIIITSLF